MEKTTLSVNGLDFEYVREKAIESIKVAKTSTVCFFVIVLIISIVLMWFQISDNTIFYELIKYCRIKNSVKEWGPLVESKSQLESDKGRLLAEERKDLLNFHCVDFGSFFLPIRLDSNTYLQQAIRRGSGDGWMVKKASKVDLSAQQFCEYLIKYKHDNVITCGTDMLNTLGYSGFFETGHWCKEYSDLLN
ncbi:hypothetical protein [Cetacean poxvirus 1]|nr:hypothetical protein [Cetacean poxvirus 1]